MRFDTHSIPFAIVALLVLTGCATTHEQHTDEDGNVYYSITCDEKPACLERAEKLCEPTYEEIDVNTLTKILAGITTRSIFTGDAQFAIYVRCSETD